MKDHLDSVLASWPYQPGALQVRTVQAGGREVIQIRVDLGILQLEPAGRPDGTRPFGFSTYFDYLRDRVDRHRAILSSTSSAEATASSSSSTTAGLAGWCAPV